MAKIKIKYLVTKKRKNGSFAHYWQPNKALRKGGWKTTPLGNTPSRMPSGEIMTAAEDINIQVENWRAGRESSTETGRPGTVDALIKDYKKSEDFLDLAAKTQREYTTYLNIISQWAGDQMAVTINAKMCGDLYKTIKKTKPRKATFLMQVVRLLFNYGERTNAIPKNTNPATKMKLTYKAAKGKLWTPQAVKAFVKQADEADFFSIGTAVWLNEWIGQRKGDIINMPMTAYQDGVLDTITQNKTQAEVEGLDLNAVPDLKARIELQIEINNSREYPGTVLIQQEDGNPFSEHWFAHMVRDIRLAGEKKEETLKGMVFKDLRHTAVTRLAEAGCTIPEIAAVTGHSFKAVEDILDRYNIRTRKLARNALIKRAKAERN